MRDWQNMWGGKAKGKQWRNLGALIVDEVGMLSAEFLEWMDITVRQMRGALRQAFGGVQLVFCGDFAQLPPVNSAGGSDMRGLPAQREKGERACIALVDKCT